jgi:hypothetical protein
MPKEVEEIFQLYLDNGRFAVTSDGTVTNTKTGRVVGNSPNSKGYGVVSIKHEGKIIGIPTRRLVWMKFNGPIPSGMFVAHKNKTDKIDCAIDSLQLLTPAEIMHRTVKSGKANVMLGENNASAKFTRKQVIFYRLLYASGFISVATIAKKVGVSRPVASWMLKGKTYGSYPNAVPQIWSREARNRVKAANAARLRAGQIVVSKKITEFLLARTAK